MLKLMGFYASWDFCKEQTSIGSLIMGIKTLFKMIYLSARSSQKMSWPPAEWQQ